MKPKNMAAKYIGLFMVTFALSVGFVISFAGRAAADCSVVPICVQLFDECPEGSDCPGDPCSGRYDHRTLSIPNGPCCGVVVQWNCDVRR